jgi:hypothetical protein
MYLLDTGVLITLGLYFPGTFPTIWSKIDGLVVDGEIESVREVRNEIERNCQFAHIEEWVKQNRKIFKTPSPNELMIVENIFKEPRFQALVRRESILKGSPVADPFLIAAGKAKGGVVVTMEKATSGGAKIPDVCRALDVRCINVEGWFQELKIKY